MIKLKIIKTIIKKGYGDVVVYISSIFNDGLEYCTGIRSYLETQDISLWVANIVNGETYEYENSTIIYNFETDTGYGKEVVIRFRDITIPEIRETHFIDEFMTKEDIINNWKKVGIELILDDEVLQSKNATKGEGQNETIVVGSKSLKIMEVEKSCCKGCYFNINEKYNCAKLIKSGSLPNCNGHVRKDRKNMIFVDEFANLSVGSSFKFEDKELVVRESNKRCIGCLFKNKSSEDCMRLQNSSKTPYCDRIFGRIDSKSVIFVEKEK